MWAARRRRALLAFLLALVALAAQVPCAAAADQGEQAAAKLKRLQSEIAHLNAKVGAEIARQNHLTAELGKAEQKIGSLQRKLAALDAQEKRLADQKAQLDQKAAASHDDAEKAQKELSAALRTAFILGQQPRVKLALEGENPSQAARLLAYYGYYSRASARRIHELAAEVERYRKLRQDISATETGIARARSSQRQALAELKKSQTQRSAALAALKHDIAGKKTRIAALKRDAERLKKVIQSVNRDLARTPSKALKNLDFRKLRGKLPWPVAGKIVDRFGSARTDAGEMHWEAVRIAAPAGTRVHAIARGRVAYAGWLPYYGLVLMVDHGDGYLTVYGHNEALYKQVGQRVEPGDVIATVGQSGGQTKPMLYFQIRHGSRPLDPARWCRGSHPPSN